MQFSQPDTLVPNPGNPLDWNRYSYSRYNPVFYKDPSGHWPEWWDWLQGAVYQYTNDMSMGTIDQVAYSLNVCLDCNVSDAYREGQQAGRYASTTVSSVEQVAGAFVAGAGVAGIGPTAGGGSVCALLTGGLCSIPTGGALIIEGGMVVVGSLEAMHGSGVIAFSKNHSVKNPDLFGAKGTQFTSKKLWQGKQGMLHAENPNPGLRKGQIHFQEFGQNGNKWLYDLVNNTFVPIKPGGPDAPAWLLEMLNDDNFMAGINKGLSALGE